ncbi:DinB family protein [Dyadobacter frigoris]|uniref:DinB family protein n=1 Tax=Dyadobacter frigoris TaxID=2576211 RepID=A0A4U6DE11_9BACT|nr:DinB family protein [Dyadobacter frigoris]TKT92714.1 DinB family protein [Dyadobacter frigoris]GLU51606.1 DNA damage-inducible protein DinB [Dyadobacter frigoris]
MTKIDRPKLEDAPPWYPYFFNLTIGDDLISALQQNKADVIELINSIPAEREDFKYAENKWTIRQVFIHLTDDERYYAYKAYCYSRQIDVFLEVPQGNDYNKDFNVNGRTLEDISEELISVRDATITLFSHMTNDMLDYKFPNQTEEYSARSLGWMTVGHAIHHCTLVREKYLI